MSPGNPLYFDNGPDKNSIYNVYHFNPIPAGLNAGESSFIIGAQANIWSEYIPSENRADHMFMPRMTALAEMLWTNNQSLYDSYESRLIGHYKRLDLLKVHYRLPDLEGIVTEHVFTDKDTLMVKRPLPEMRVNYTTDGSLPNSLSRELKTPLIIDQPLTVRVAAFTGKGLRGDLYTIHYKKENYHPATDATGTSAGLQCSYYKAFFQETSLIAKATADSSFVIPSITVPNSVNAPSFALSYRGYHRHPCRWRIQFFPDLR